uniref:Uncharacterized protein n=1 Tax=Anguilla anguilla TaxID=7936 RepID=A0A0E9WJS0_ANGAN
MVMLPVLCLEITWSGSFFGETSSTDKWTVNDPSRMRKFLFF